MGSITRSGGYHRDKYLVGDWTEILVTLGGTNYPIGCVRNAELVLTSRVYAHRESRSAGSAFSVVAKVSVGMELKGRLCEIHRENLRLLLDKVPTGPNQVDVGTELSPLQFFTVRGHRPNAEGGTDPAAEFCIWKCRSADLVQFESIDDFLSMRFRFVGLDDTDGDYGGDEENPFGWIYSTTAEEEAVTDFTSISSHVIPSADDTYDLGSLSPLRRWRRLHLSQYITMDGINPVSNAPPNISLYVDDTDSDKLKYKDGAGSIFDLTSTNAAIASPATYNADTTDNYPAGLPDGTTDQIDIATPDTGDEFTEGMIAKVTLTDSDALGSGDVRVRLYNDQARTECIFDQYFDLAVTPLIAVIPAHFQSDGILGDAAIYVDITNHTGTTADFQVDVRVAGILTGSMGWGGGGTGVGAANARDGLGWDGTGLYTDLLIGGGLGLSGATPNKKLYVVAGNGISVGATVSIDTSVAMALDEAQTVTVLKRFAAGAIGWSAHGSTVGPPTTGTWVAGDFFVDVNLLIWRCIVGGTPGTWQFFGSSLDENIDSDISAAENNATYTTEITCENSLNVTLDVSANFGYIQKLLVWASQDSFPTGDLDQPFRIACFPNSNREQRDMLWVQPGQWRKVSMAAGMTGGVDNVAQVTDVDVGAEDELVRMRALAGPYEEYARIQTRDSSAVAFTLHEAVLNDFAADDPVMFVTELVMLPFMNNDSLNPRKLFLTIYNDGEAGTDADVVVGYQLNLQFLGGGSNY